MMAGRGSSALGRRQNLLKSTLGANLPTLGAKSMNALVRNLSMPVSVAVLLAFAGVSTLAQAPVDQTKPAVQSPSATNPDVQYMQILSQLLHVRLQRIKQLNAQVPGTVTDDDIALLELQAKSVDQLAAQAKDGKETDWFSLVLVWAQISNISADHDWQRVAKVRQQSPQAISEPDAEMVRLRAQLATANLERGKAVQNKSADDRQNWALQYLVMEVQTLQDKTQRLEERE
jgi:hypothetical protein